MSCECQCNNENKEKKNILHTFYEVMVIIGLFAFLIIGCSMFRKAEDKRFDESSMFFCCGRQLILDSLLP